MIAGTWVAHAGSELRQLARAPGYLVPTLIFPAMLFSFFGLTAANQYPQSAPTMLASWSVYAVLGVAFYQFGVGFAQSREMHWSTYLRTLPAGPAPQIVAQLAVAVIFAVLAIGILWAFAFAMTPARYELGQALRLVGALALGAIPFAGLGIAIGYSVSARAAVPVANLIYLPMTFAGGLWWPPDKLPGAIQQLSPYLPTRMFGEIVWAAVDDRAWPLAPAGGLAAYGVLFLGFAAWRHGREERRRFR